MNAAPSFAARLLTFPLVAFALLASRGAFAQEAAEDPPVPAPPSKSAVSSGWFDPPAAQPAPRPAPAPAAPSPPPPEPEEAPSTCRLGDHPGIPLPDATTAAELVCAEIARLGPAPSARYRVSLSKLGKALILSVSREDGASGKTTDFRQVRLDAIEEVPVAAPRIARAIILDLPIEETQKVDNLVGEETRVPKSKPGSTHFALGLFTLLAPLDQGLSAAPGIDLGVHHETGDGRWEIGGNFLAGGGGPSNGPSMAFFSLSVGGKYFTSDGDFSPYIGGGLAWSFLNLSTADGSFDGNGNGIGAYGEVGVQVLRTHHAHLAFGARFDLPFYSLTNNYYSSEITSNGSYSSTSYSSKYYYAPLSLEVRLTF